MAIFEEYKENTGEVNMRIDSEILNRAINNKLKDPVLRLYGWNPPCVSLGKNQKIDNINFDYCKRKGIDTVRRETGGRGLLHDDEITYSFVCSEDFLENGGSVIVSYKEISQALIKSFEYLGIELKFGGSEKYQSRHDYCMLLATGADLCFKGRKLIGSAQCRKQNYILQHGSIPFSYDKSTLEKIFNEPVDLNAITCLNEINKSITRKDVIFSLQNGFKEVFNM